MTDGLPAGWAETTLRHAAHINPPGAWTVVPDDQAVTFLPMAAVDELTGKVSTAISRPFGDVKKGFTRFRDGDVLFAKITPCMENGKIVVARGLLGGVGCGSTEFHVLRPKDAVDADYLRYFLVRSTYRREAQLNMQGAVGQQRVPPDFLRESPIPLPPPAEQRRIVSRIEELFGAIDEGERALKRVQRLVERYRQSVLKAAFRGQLVGRRHTALLPNALTAESACEELLLPSGWSWTSINELKQFSLYGPRFSSDAYSSSGYAVLRTTDISKSGRVDTAKCPRIQLSKQEFAKYKVVRGDLLVTRTGSLGTLALFDDEVEAIPGAYLIQFRLAAPDVTRRLVYHFLRTPVGQRALRLGGAGVGRPNLNAPTIEAISIPLPPIEEQPAIVEAIESAMTSLDALVPEFERCARLVSVQRQAVLTAAFSGHLAPQDSADEPAATLLARLVAQAGDTPAVVPRRRGRLPAGARS